MEILFLSPSQNTSLNHVAERIALTRRDDPLLSAYLLYPTDKALSAVAGIWVHNGDTFIPILWTVLWGPGCRWRVNTQVKKMTIPGRKKEKP